MTDLIGKTATIVGYSEAGDRVSPDNEAVAHICLDIEDGPCVFFQATDPDVVLRIVEYPRSETASQWLIERGQPEGEQQPVWLKHTATVLADEARWTSDANDAACFPTLAIAEEWIAEHGLTARAVEHGFMLTPSPTYGGSDD